MRSTDKAGHWERCSRTHGFSLMEMLVSIAIIVLLMSAVFPFLFQAQKRFQGNVVISEASQSARAGLEVMAQEIGQAGYNPHFTPNKFSSTSITTNGCTQFINLTDSSGNPDITGIHPGDWVSVDTGSVQELAEVVSTSSPNSVTGPGSICSTPTSGCTGACTVPTSGAWIGAKFEFCHNSTALACGGSPANNPYIISSYKMPFASGILVAFDASGNLITNGTRSNNERLQFYGDINQDGTIQYVVYSISPMVPAQTVTVSGTTYTLFNLYRSITTVPFLSLPSGAYTPSCPGVACNNQASPMVEKVIYNTTTQTGPTGQPIFRYPDHQQIGTAPNVYTALGTIVITLCVAVNPQAMETGQVTWYTMATQIRPLNLNAAINVNNNYGGLYIPPTPNSLPMAYDASNYYP
jgi:prepilin-type N-terminal cleavage/methylation domain-containing protein